MTRGNDLQVVYLQRSQTLRSNRLHLDEGNSYSNVRSERLSWCGRDGIKHKKRRIRTGKRTFLLLFSKEKKRKERKDKNMKRQRSSSNKCFEITTAGGRDAGPHIYDELKI